MRRVRFSSTTCLLGEVRVRLGGSCAGTLPRNVPHTFYGYTANGNLSSIQYPYGRTVTYGYGTAGGVTTDRVSSISVSKWNGTAWAPWQAIQSIVFEPFGDVRAWQLNGDSGPLSVENMARDVTPAVPSGHCPIPKPTTNDLSGRVQLVQVSTGPLTLWTGSGNVFQRRLTLDAQNVTAEAACWTAATRPIEIASYSYTQGGQAVIYSGQYDLRGNRLQMRTSTTSGQTDTWAYSDAGVADRLAQWQRAVVGPVTHSHDEDGRTTALRWGTDSSGATTAEEVWTPAGTESMGSGGLDSVYKSVSVSGGVYAYYYDATNRRRLKQYPTGVSDEYFYSSDNHLLVDRGNAAIASPVPHH